MYDQLKTLEKMILDIKKQYQTVSHELSTLKAAACAATDPKELAALQSKVDTSHAERDEAKKHLKDLDNRYQSLAEAHHMIGEEQDKLQKKISHLQQQNSELQQHNKQLKQQYNDVQEQNSELQKKNQLAAERTQVVLKRLTRIDQAEGS